ncbi:hypothetical protein H310_15161 [Aphanomyces invadans]|uniref:Myb-like domain-containing protein n=1 Tax=Aphanomyces invadans TaxID=157072 RepID=A0A024T8Q8_9STRA|nr:hypothetical protein H310_15161 [Aphanomyces invadans]ETV89996.1 hypothetical protein H310_15161 [Aphanomyces invadans]|eukprot:XP_008881370.1 hypothetical protein H310_15161 [Aphanomyces invadans]
MSQNDKSSEKRRNWSHEEDIALLIQVAADRPFAAEKGQLKKAWQGLAETLVACEHFGRVVDGKKVQNRFLFLAEEHRKFDAQSAKLSGVAEEEKEKHVLLDDILNVLQDMKSEQRCRPQGQDESDKVEKGGLYVREMAMKTMKRRSDGDGEEKTKRHAVENRRDSLAAAIATESERELTSRANELEFQRHKLECEMNERKLDREDRKAEREYQLALANIESAKMTNIIQALLESRK